MEEAPLPTLQPDALIQIFHKLPIRSLLECKLVCKEWCALISDPSFKSDYISSSIPNHPINLLMIPRWHNRPTTTRVDSALRYQVDWFENRVARRNQPLPKTNSSENHNFTIMGSWNGLIALHHDCGDFHLLNPHTGEENSVHVTLDPNTRWSTNLCGLSYDSSNREYKAVLSVGNLSLCVVSFKNGESKLKSHSSVIDIYSWSPNKTGIVVNGVPHWIVNNKICYFDHCKEEIREMMKPKEWDGKVLCSLGALDGKLAVVLRKNVARNYMVFGGLEVWVLKDFSDHQSWSSLFVIVNKLRHVSPLSAMNDDEVLMDVNREELMVYNHKSHTIRQLQPKMKRKLYTIITYYPSFTNPSSP